MSPSTTTPCTASLQLSGLRRPGQIIPHVAERGGVLTLPTAPRCPIQLLVSCPAGCTDADRTICAGYGGHMLVSWSEEIDAVLGGDLTAALTYLTPAGGAVATAVAPIGLRDRQAGWVGFTTSLGFGKSSTESSATRTSRSRSTPASTGPPTASATCWSRAGPRSSPTPMRPS